MQQPPWKANTSLFVSQSRNSLHFITPKTPMPRHNLHTHLSLSWARSIQSKHPILFYLISILISLFDLLLRLPSDLYSSSSPPKSRVHLSFPPCMPHATPIPFLLIWSSEKYFVWRTNHEAHKRGTSYNFVPILPCQTPISAARAPCFRAPVAHVHSSMWEVTYSN
jgi:hypothetical protein